MLGKIKGRRRRGQQRRRWLDGIINSMAKLLEIITVKPCMLQSMGLQRTKHNLETEQPQGKQSISGHLNTATLSLCCFMKERTETCWEFPGCPVVKTSPSYTVGVGSIPGQEAKIPHTSWPKNQNIKQKQCCNKFNKDFKKMVHIKNFFKKLKKYDSAILALGIQQRKFYVYIYVCVYIYT